MEPSFSEVLIFKFLVFSELHDLNRSLGLNAQALARNNNKFLRNSRNLFLLNHVNEFSGVVIFKYSSVLLII